MRIPRIGFCLLAGFLVFGAASLQADWIENGVPLCTEAGYQLQPAATADNHGGAIVVWWDYRAESVQGIDLYAQRVDADGNLLWALDGVPICTQPGDQYAAAVVSDGAGGAIIAWHDNRSGDYQWDIYAQHVDGAGHPLWAVDGVLVCGAGQYQTYPRIVTDTHHGAVIAWEDERGYVSTDIYAQRVDGNGNLLWAANGMPVCTYNGVQENFVMASDDSGGAYFAWQDPRSGGVDYWDIYGQRLNSLGARQWILNGLRVCGAADDQEWPGIMADADGVIIAWSDSRSAGVYDRIYAQRVDPPGNTQWTMDGVLVHVGTGSQLDPRLASDDAGGAIVAWRDVGGADWDVRAQRLDADGVRQWPPVVVSGAPGDQLAPRIVPDGSGGAILAWEDRRVGTGEEEIYAQRVDANGNTLWDVDGKAICTAPYGQRHLDLVRDGTDGGIVTWSDNRSGSDWDIYAQDTHYTASGAVDDVAAGSLDALCRPYPNPSRSGVAVSFAPEAGRAAWLGVHDASGRLIRRVTPGPENARLGQLVWDGRDSAGREATSGTYVCRLSIAGREIVRRVIRTR